MTARPRRASLLSWLLTLSLMAGLGAVNWALLTRPPSVPVPTAATPVATAEPGAAETGLAPPVAPSIETFAEILSRPLFSPSRRMPEAKTAAAAPEPAAVPTVAPPRPPPAFRLSGVLIRKPASRALIVPLGGGAGAWLEIGQSMGDWTLTRIAETSVRLESKGEAVTLELYGAGGGGVETAQ